MLISSMNAQPFGGLWAHGLVHGQALPRDVEGMVNGVALEVRCIGGLIGNHLIVKVLLQVHLLKEVLDILHDVRFAGARRPMKQEAHRLVSSRVTQGCFRIQQPGLHQSSVGHQLQKPELLFVQ